MRTRSGTSSAMLLATLLLTSAACSTKSVVVAPAPEPAPAETPAPAEPSVPAVTVPAPPARPLGLVGIALESLEGHVVAQSHPDALASAVHAYFEFRSKHPERVRKPYLYYVDFGLSSDVPRGYVFDMEELTVVEGPFAVAHGVGSAGGKRWGVPMSFSNVPGSLRTSLGLYVAAETYTFRGRSGGSRYTSIGLRMDGVSDGFNDNARARGVVAHGAPYVSRLRAGRSEGCPAMAEDLAQRLLPMLSGGGMVFHFSPNDEEWLHNDTWLPTGR